MGVSWFQQHAALFIIQQLLSLIFDFWALFRIKYFDLDFYGDYVWKNVNLIYFHNISEEVWKMVVSGKVPICGTAIFSFGSAGFVFSLAFLYEAAPTTIFTSSQIFLSRLTGILASVCFGNRFLDYFLRRIIPTHSESKFCSRYLKVSIYTYRHQKVSKGED